MLPNIGSNEAKGFPLVVWDDVCRPKSEGGLGIRRNEDVNKALIIKLGWRILTDNDSIWAKIMRDKYVKNNNFFRISKKECDFIVWKEVINHKKYIGVDLKWCVGDGRKVSFRQTTGYICYLLFLLWMKIIYITLIRMPKCMVL